MSFFALPSIRRVGRRVTDPAQVVTEFDSITSPRVLPDGRRICVAEMACNIAGAVGLPAGVFIERGLPVHEDWLVEVRNHQVVGLIGRVFGAHSLLPRGEASS